ncbi:MAG: hypothetical protein GY828_04285 [Candidatus Gracilibacteria bacterium]|nr:hypothetical protein [Candidatus Gracilibacteria bacterium]
MGKQTKDNSNSFLIYIILASFISLVGIVIFFMGTGTEKNNVPSTNEETKVVPYGDEVQKLMEQQLKNPMNIMEVTCTELSTDEGRKYCSNKQIDIKKLLK